MAPRCRLRHRPGFPGDTDEPRLGLAIIFGTGITSDAPGSAQGLTTSLPCRETSAGAYGSRTGLAEALRRVRRSRTASTRSRPRSAPRNAAHRARGRAADVAALAVHIITDTALAGATYDIDGGQQLIPT